MFNCCLDVGIIPKEHLYFKIYCISRDNLLPNPSNYFIYWTIKDKYKLLDRKYLLKTFSKHLLITYNLKIKTPIYMHVFFHLEIPLEYKTKKTNKLYQNLFNYQQTENSDLWIPFLQYFKHLFNNLKEEQTYNLIIRICRKEYKHLIS